MQSCKSKPSLIDSNACPVSCGGPLLLLSLHKYQTCCCLKSVMIVGLKPKAAAPHSTPTQTHSKLICPEFRFSQNSSMVLKSCTYAAGAGVGGSNATCVNVATAESYGESGTGGGGLGFSAVEGTTAGYQPFAGKTTLDFWVKSNSTGPGDESEAAYPKGSLPDLNVYLSKAAAKQFCGNTLQLTDLTPSGTEQTGDGGTYYHFQIPLDSFNCDGGSAGSLANIDSLGFGSNSGADYASFCIDDLLLA